MFAFLSISYSVINPACFSPENACIFNVNIEHFKSNNSQFRYMLPLFNYFILTRLKQGTYFFCFLEGKVGLGWVFF